MTRTLRKKRARGRPLPSGACPLATAVGLLGAVRLLARPVLGVTRLAHRDQACAGFAVGDVRVRDLLVRAQIDASLMHSPALARLALERLYQGKERILVLDLGRVDLTVVH